jgi:hypothetical protein
MGKSENYETATTLEKYTNYETAPQESVNIWERT